MDRPFIMITRFTTPLSVFLCALVVLLAFTFHASAQGGVDLDSPTTGWTPVLYLNNNPDPSSDQQTGSEEGDIVGNLAHPSVYTKFDDAGTTNNNIDGTLAFRVRLGADVSPAGFKTALFVGVDANGDGKLDIFIGVNNSGSHNEVGIWTMGPTANNSPSTTTISNSPVVSNPTDVASNYYRWVPVTTTNPFTIDPTLNGASDIDGGGNVDYFLSFSISFGALVNQLSLLSPSISITDQSSLSYVIETATQANSLNQDLNGIGKIYDPNATYASLGIISNAMIVPEPSVVGAVILGGLALAGCRKRRA